MLNFLERRLLFRPRPFCPATPADYGLDFEATRTDTADGRALQCWYIPGPPDSGLTWLWFGGVGANLGLRVADFAAVRQHTGGSIMAFDYGGFGQSQGPPSVRHTAYDARAALEHLQQRYGIPAASAHYFGVSMGAAVAVRLAAEQHPRGMALVAPFAALRDMGRLLHPILTLGGIAVGRRFNSLDYVDAINCPLLILHGKDDELVPPSQGRKLYDAARTPKRFAELPGVGHLDIGETPDFWTALCGWLEDEFALPLPATSPALS